MNKKFNKKMGICESNYSENEIIKPKNKKNEKKDKDNEQIKKLKEELKN